MGLGYNIGRHIPKVLAKLLHQLLGRGCIAGFPRRLVGQGRMALLAAFGLTLTLRPFAGKSASVLWRQGI
jgi:hypothetical protein